MKLFKNIATKAFFSTIYSQETLFWALKVVCKVADKAAECENFVDNFVRKILDFERENFDENLICNEKFKLC
jgi:hypothetical protein